MFGDCEYDEAFSELDIDKDGEVKYLKFLIDVDLLRVDVICLFVAFKKPR